MSKSKSGQPADEHLAVPPLLQRMKFDNVRERPAPPAAKPFAWRRWLCALLLALLLLAGFMEYRSSYLQSLFWHNLAQGLSYQLLSGQTEAVHYPEAGPFDQRAGYSLLADWLPRLTLAGFHIQ
ncbi:hypothetical protein [Arsukibacterium sp.]|uniref:hypothetical protein n=1 Tax=Arsukibacterium sp. TaxID=1977258 RepID=UPI002FD9E79E